jgi:hypothetical protein
MLSITGGQRIKNICVQDKPNGINRTAEIGYGHLGLRRENLSFNDNYIIKD